MELNREPEVFSKKFRLLRMEGSLQAFATFLAAATFIFMFLLVVNPKDLEFPKPWLLTALFTLVVLNTLVNVLIHYIRNSWMDIEKQAGTDKITGTLTRVHFEKLLDEELRRGGRYHYPVTLCYLDLDEFGSFNEHFGRQQGDDLLRKFGQLLQGAIRFADCVARYQKDEFCVLLPHTDIVRAEKFIARILAQSQERLDFTFCGGVTSYQAGENKAQFIMRALSALGQAKREGKKKIRYVVGDNTATVSF